MKLFGEISKTEELDDGTIKVWGYASSEAVDSDGETITSDAMKAAVADYMKFGAVREMHQPKAAGTAIEMAVQDDGRTWFGAHVVDSEAVKKVKASVYKGFSIGGKVTERDELNKTVIKGIKLVEVSLVDRPANPEAVFTMYKAETVDDGTDENAGHDSADAVHNAGGGTDSVAKGGSADAQAANGVSTEGKDGQSDSSKADTSSLTIPAIDELADMLNKGEITPEKLLALAKGDHSGDSNKMVEDKPGEAIEKSAEEIKKGLYTVARFASILNEIGYLQQDTAWEAEYEGDNSTLPAQLKDWFASGVPLLQAMVTEEANEMMAQMGGVEVLAMAAKGGDIAKAGARFSKATKESLGAIHKAAKECCDHLDKLGYEEAEEDGEKAAKGDDLAKVSAGYELAVTAAKAAGMGDNHSVDTFIKVMADELTKAQARISELEAKPAPGKALLKAVVVGKDGSAEILDDSDTGVSKFAPIKDASGEVNEVASLIKMVHSQGGAITPA